MTEAWPEIVLIRHGQTDSNAAGVLQGHLPTTLNAVGRHQAARLADRLRTFVPPIEHLISSDLRRALETAAPIAAALGLVAELSAAWRERGFGSLEGQTLGELDIWRAAAGGGDPPGGERRTEFERRVSAALSDVADAHRERRAVAVVTHGGPIRLLLDLMAAGRVPLAAGVSLPAVAGIANSSLLRVVPERSAGRLAWRVLAVNDVAHLEGFVTTSDPG
ncbi:MAG: histidine phosphatase family protein [Acidobacteria bacterium]|nr:histidine phosphatase family protein [Acidobacteriota bacterium]